MVLTYSPQAPASHPTMYYKLCKWCCARWKKASASRGHNTQSPNDQPGWKGEGLKNQDSEVKVCVPVLFSTYPHTLPLHPCKCTSPVSNKLNSNITTGEVRVGQAFSRSTPNHGHKNSLGVLIPLSIVMGCVCIHQHISKLAKQLQCVCMFC